MSRAWFSAEALKIHANVHERQHGLLRSLSKRFPFGIFYELTGTTLEITSPSLPSLMRSSVSHSIKLLCLLAAVAGLATAMSIPPFVSTHAADPAAPLQQSAPDHPPEAAHVQALQGKPALALGEYDVAELGYEVHEFLLSGTAASYEYTRQSGEGSSWRVTTGESAAYTTRAVVVRPSDPSAFSGSVIVEWLNVTAGFDMPVEWTMTHREIMRRGHAYMAVSAQHVGIEGQASALPAGLGVGPLKTVSPDRYALLHHPGDAYAYDIFSQAGAAVDRSGTNGLLGPCVPQRVIAVGESQSAMFLTTYVAAVDPLARIFDGFLIHSRCGMAAPLHGNMLIGMAFGPKECTFGAPLRVPVLTVVAENDVVGWPPIAGFLASRQPDNEHLRIWEIAGTAHADNYLFSVGFIDSGLLPTEQLASAFQPTSKTVVGSLDQPANCAPQHHYVVQAALWQLNRWLENGEPPPKAEALQVTNASPAGLVTDEHGLARGGVRSPWMDVPTMLLSGVGNSGHSMAGMLGVGKPFSREKLSQLYPGGKSAYLKKFEAALSEAIKQGFLLADDRDEILAIASANFLE